MTEKYKSKILMKEFVTHDVIRFIIEKPENYEFAPGQATLIAINKKQDDEKDWTKESRPFTFTSLNSDLVLEFTIKIYNTSENPNHKAMTEKLSQLKPGDELLIEKPWGAIQYKGEGIFIAGGAGITPFIAILRQLKKENKLQGNKLIFSNKTKKDIILEKEFKDMFSENPENIILTLTKQTQEHSDNKTYNKNGYIYEKINKEFLKTHITQEELKKKFYICGPPQFVKDISDILKQLGANTEEIVFEK